MRGHAILVGVSEVNNHHYGRSKKFKEARENVNKLYQFIGSQDNFDLNEEDKFIGHQAIWNDVKLRLNHYAKLSRTEEGYLFFYLAGHGFNHNFQDGSTKAFFYFYDQLVIAKEIQIELKKISASFKVFWVVDSCYSKGFTIKRVELKLDDLEKAFGDRKSSVEIIDFYRDKFDIESRGKYAAQIAFMGASGKLKKARRRGAEGMSLFSYKSYSLLTYWLSKGIHGNYIHFFNELALGMPDFYQPVSDFLGNNSHYFKTKIPLKLISNNNLKLHKMNCNITITSTNPEIDDQVTAEIECDSKCTLLEVVTYYKNDNALPESITSKIEEHHDIVMVAYVKLGGKSTSFSIPSSLSFMNYDDITTTPSNGVIVIYDLALSTVYATKEPTKGTVSNGLG